MKTLELIVLTPFALWVVWELIYRFLPKGESWASASFYDRP